MKRKVGLTGQLHAPFQMQEFASDYPQRWSASVERQQMGRCVCGAQLDFGTDDIGRSLEVCVKCGAVRRMVDESTCRYCGEPKADHPVNTHPNTKRQIHCNIDYNAETAHATPLPFGLRALSQDDKNELQLYMRP